MITPSFRDIQSQNRMTTTTRRKGYMGSGAGSSFPTKSGCGDDNHRRLDRHRFIFVVLAMMERLDIVDLLFLITVLLLSIYHCS